MNHRGFSLIIVLLVVSAVLTGGGIWYYETHLSVWPQPSSTPATTVNPIAITTTTTTASDSSTTFYAPTATQQYSSSSSWINLQVNGSHGPISLGLGSNVNLVWTSQNVTGCHPVEFWGGYPPIPLPSSGSFTTTWSGGLPYDVGASSYQIACADTLGDTLSDTVQVSPVPLMLTLTPNSAVANPHPVFPSGHLIRPEQINVS
jgi:hypothetical protein